MFISKRRFILKTCGTTTPLLCLEPLLHLVEQYANFTCVEDLFYSRKNYKRPELQVTPHQNFEQEVIISIFSFFFLDFRNKLRRAMQRTKKNPAVLSNLANSIYFILYRLPCWILYFQMVSLIVWAL